MPFNQRLAEKIGLTKSEIAILRRLKTPEAIQDYLTAMPSNAELHGDTAYSVRAVLREKCCHCIEGAFVAACALMLHGHQPLYVNLKAKGDDDHALVLFKRGTHWGAISKSNHIWLRWRDPIYRNPRELVMSYFHEYVYGTKKTLRAMTRPIDLSKYDPKLWITPEENCWEIAAEFFDMKHEPLLSPAQVRRLRKREKFEVKANELIEFEI
jgi:hypothetical protein